MPNAHRRSPASLPSPAQESSISWVWRARSTNNSLNPVNMSLFQKMTHSLGLDTLCLHLSIFTRQSRPYASNPLHTVDLDRWGRSLIFIILIIYLPSVWPHTMAELIRALTSYAEVGVIKSWPSQNNDLQNRYFLLHICLALDINRIGAWLANSVLG